LKLYEFVRIVLYIAISALNAVGWAAGRASGLQNRVVGCWYGCLERGADLHMAQLMPLTLTVSCFTKIQIGFTFLVLAHLGSPGKGPLNGCVCSISMPVMFYKVRVFLASHKKHL